MVQNLFALEERLGVRFVRRALLEEALTHTSFANERRRVSDMTVSNERLEFLGDAVLSLAVSQILMTRFSGLTEGELTRLRASLVNMQTLARKAHELGLNLFIRLGHGEEQSGGRDKHSIMANAYEALMGAFFLDSNLEQVMLLVEKEFSEEIKQIDELGLEGLDKDYKTILQEIVQAYGWKLPLYRLLREEGPEHDRVFTVAIDLNAETGFFVEASGEGRNRKSAEQEAARLALLQLREAKL